MASMSSMVNVAALERAQDLDHAVKADAIGDEVRRVLRDDHALAQPQIEESRHACDDIGIGVGGRDHLDQRQIAWRIEEMGAEPVAAKLGASAFGDRVNRNAGGVGRDDRARPPDRFDCLEQRALDVELLDDGFENPVDRGEAAKVRVETARRDQCGRVR